MANGYQRAFRVDLGKGTSWDWVRVRQGLVREFLFPRKSLTAAPTEYRSNFAVRANQSPRSSRWWARGLYVRRVIAASVPWRTALRSRLRPWSHALTGVLGVVHRLRIGRGSDEGEPMFDLDQGKLRIALVKGLQGTGRTI